LFEGARAELVGALDAVEEAQATGWTGRELASHVMTELRQVLDELEELSADESLLLDGPNRARLVDAIDRVRFVSEDVRSDHWQGSNAGIHYQYLESAVAALHVIPEQLEELQQSALVLSDEHGVSPATVTVLQHAAERLLAEIGSDPEEWIHLGSRRFEEILAEIWAGLGWETALTPPANDGGFDIRAVRSTNGMCLCYLVEAKAYRPDRPVGIAAVRHLYGVVEKERASHGVIATTSRFTRGAQAAAATLRYRVTLADFQQVLDWVAEYRRLR
jgi:Restriction endonuclease